MSPWEANLAVLDRVHPALAQQLRAGGEGPSRGAWSISRTGLPAVRRDGVSLSSAFDPQKEAAQAVPDWDHSVVFAVVVGLGAGYLVEAVVQRYPDLPVVIAEADPLWFAEVLAHRDLAVLWENPRVVVLLGPRPEVVGEFLRPFACTKVEVLTWRPLEAQESGWQQAVRDQVAQAQTRASVNSATYRKFGSLWRRNWRKNQTFGSDLRPVSALRGWAQGLPGVVAAAGPSLADRLDWMTTHRDRFVLIAVDTAWPTLAAHGLTPDVLLVLDGQYWNGRHVDRPLAPRTLVVTEWIGPPRAFRLAPGRTFVAASSVPFLRGREEQLWGPLGDLPTGGSVATAAWSLALLIGCSQVAFAGLDLGFPRGQTHVPGSQFEEALHRRSRRLSPAETLGLGLRGPGLTWRPALDGGLVQSDPRMDLFRDWMSKAVAAHPEVRAYNLGEKGSVIQGLSRPREDWITQGPPIPWLDVPQGPTLHRRSSTPVVPPFALFRRSVPDDEFSQWVDHLWAVARDYWGSDVWEAWAGRVRLTWDRWPSARTRRVVEELVALTLDWEPFWEDG